MLRPLTHRESAECYFIVEYLESALEDCRGGWYYTLMSFAQGVARKQIKPSSKRAESLITKILKESTEKFEKIHRGL